MGLRFDHAVATTGLYVIGLLLMGMMPCALFLLMIAERAEGDIGR